MICRDMAERITALVDGELSPAEREELERHLAGCSSCGEARAAEEEVAARVRALGRPPLPGGFREAVMGRVRAATPPSAAAPRAAGRLIPLWAWTAAGAAAAAGLLAMATWGDGSSPRGSTVAGGARPPASPAAPLDAPAAETALIAAEEEVKGEAKGLEYKQKAPDTGFEAPEGGAALPVRADEDRVGDGKEPAAAAPPTPAGAKRSAPAPEAQPDSGAGPRSGAGATAGGGAPSERDAGAESRAKLEEAKGPPPPREPAPSTEPRTADRRAAEEPPPAQPPGDDAAKARNEAKPAGKDAGETLPRLAFFYRTLNPADAEQRVERFLFLNPDIALESVGWKDASDVDSASGRLLKEMAEVRGDMQGGGVAATRPRDRVLQVRLRAKDLERLRREVGKIESMREASSVVLVRAGGRVPADVEREIRASLDETLSKGVEVDKGFTSGSTPVKEKAKEATPEPTPEPSEPAPPPLPSKGALDRLAEGTEPAKLGALGLDSKAAATGDIWVELHVVATSPPR